MSMISKKISVFVVAVILFSIPVFSWYISSAEAESYSMEEVNTNLVEIRIYSDDDIRIDGENIALNISEVEKLLRDNHAENEFLIVTVKAENDVIYKDFIILLDEVRKSESKRVLIHENLE